MEATPDSHIQENPDCLAYRVLLSGMLDNELTPEELHAVNEHLYKCAACRAEFDRLSALNQELKTKSFQEPSDYELEKLWHTHSYRIIQWIAFGLILGGCSFIVIFPLLFPLDKIANALLWIGSYCAIGIGMIILLIQVIHESIILHKKDPYKEVKR